MLYFEEVQFNRLNVSADCAFWLQVDGLVQN